MEGLAGTAIRLAVRDLSCPQGPGPGWSSVAPVSVRGPILRVAQATTTLAATSPVLAHPGRRVARIAAMAAAGAGPGSPAWDPESPVCGSPRAGRRPAAILVNGSRSADRYSGPGGALQAPHQGAVEPAPCGASGATDLHQALSRWSGRGVNPGPSSHRDLDKELHARVEPGGRLLMCPLGAEPPAPWRMLEVAKRPSPPGKGGPNGDSV
jgi:hypothetical protein